MCPHSTHLRRCSHHPPTAEHSTQPVPLGLAAGFMPSLSDFIGSASCCLAVSNARVALPNFYNIAIRIANVAARFAVLGLRLCDKLGSSTSPKVITRLNICNADVHKAADCIGIGGDAERYRWFVGCRTAPGVNKEPRVRDLDVARRAAAVASAQNATSEDRLVKSQRSFDVGNGEKVRDGEPILRRHLIGFLLDLYLVH